MKIKSGKFVSIGVFILNSTVILDVNDFSRTIFAMNVPSDSLITVAYFKGPSYVLTNFERRVLGKPIAK